MDEVEAREALIRVNALLDAWKSREWKRDIVTRGAAAKEIREAIDGTGRWLIRSPAVDP